MCADTPPPGTPSATPTVRRGTKSCTSRSPGVSRGRIACHASSHRSVHSPAQRGPRACAPSAQRTRPPLHQSRSAPRTAHQPGRNVHYFATRRAVKVRKTQRCRTPTRELQDDLLITRAIRPAPSAVSGQDVVAGRRQPAAAPGQRDDRDGRSPRLSAARPGSSAAGGCGRVAHAHAIIAAARLRIRHERDRVDAHVATSISSLDGENTVAGAHRRAGAPARPHRPCQLQAERPERRPRPGHQQPLPAVEVA